MSDLRLDDFEAYFAAVHGARPFPWQARLLRQVVANGWPRVLDLPTGSGKTAALDIALFHLALEAASEQRRAPARIVLVVDRRTVVDQASDRAEKIANALRAPSTPVLRVMREHLVALSGVDRAGSGEPLDVTALRGGVARDDGWARNPVQPLIVLSTVDQVGSRLLFRGYGVSRSMRPVHAGLLGNDALFLLDEVHLAEPFRQTLTQIAERYRGWTERDLPSRWCVVSMSATSGADGTDRFTLDSDDRSHPVLHKRLDARKPVRLVEVRVTGNDGSRVQKFADRIAEAAAPPADLPGAAVGVVLNRVRLAHLVFRRLRELYGHEAAIYLLTGRMRPLERADVECEVKRRVGAGRNPRVADDGRPTIVVATQCIEAGADLDFDVLVTECASFDALKQRFGRLNRLGESARCSGVVLVRGDRVSEDDPIYGAALAKTWAWLNNHANERDQIDFGIGALDSASETTGGLVAQRADAPVLLPAHLDMWVQTSHPPDPDPHVSLWLHGPRGAEPEVHIVWRADIDEAVLAAALQTETNDLEDLLERIEVCPPLTSEAVAVRLAAARRWLAGGNVDDEADVEGVPGTNDDERAAGAPWLALAWRGEQSAVVRPETIRPEDTLIVPSTYGGLADKNWAPEWREPVPDIGDRAAHAAGRRVLRLHKDVWRHNVGAALDAPVPDMPPRPSSAGSEDAPDLDADLLDQWLKDATSIVSQGWLSELLRSVTDTRRRRVIRFRDSHYAIVVRHRSEATTDAEVSSFIGVAVGLRAHLDGVGAFAREFAERCGLPVDIVRAIELAGRWHDAGKADPRFQQLLHGGNAYKVAVATEFLAKSALPSSDRRARLSARERSRYPSGYRHELMSAALLLHNPGALGLDGDVDRDLVLHLVASHHGWCRPLAPVAFDVDPVHVEFSGGGTTLRARSDHGLERLDSGVSDRFFLLVRRYGWFGLAWLEAILRLADHRRSEWEQSNIGGTS